MATRRRTTDEPARKRRYGEGSISAYTLADGTEQFVITVRVTDADGGTRTHRQRGFATRAEALDAIAGVRTDARRGTYLAPDRVTVEAWLVEWLAGAELKDQTRAAYARTIRHHLVPHIGGLRLQQLTPTRLQQLWRQLEAGGARRGGPLSRSSVRKVAAVLSGACRVAVDHGVLKVNPVAKSKAPTGESARSPEMKVWTPMECREFLAWAQQHRPDWAPVWRVLLYTGMRRGELVGLKWKDVDLAAGVVSVRRNVGTISDGAKRTVIGTPKSRRGTRAIDLDAGTVAVLRAHRSERAGLGLALVRPESWVFTDRTGGHLDPETVSQSFLRQQRRAGVEQIIRLHDTRHSHATHLLAAGVPSHIVARRLGDSEATLSVYSHALPQQQRDAAERVAAMIG
jgi:integrase